MVFSSFLCLLNHTYIYHIFDVMISDFALSETRQSWNIFPIILSNCFDFVFQIANGSDSKELALKWRPRQEWQVIAYMHLIMYSQTPKLIIWLVLIILCNNNPKLHQSIETFMSKLFKTFCQWVNGADLETFSHLEGVCPLIHKKGD